MSGVKVIIFVFLLIAFLAILIGIILLKLIKAYPKLSGVFELLGYFLLFIALGFSLISNSLGGLKRDSQDFIINEKLTEIKMLNDKLATAIATNNFQSYDDFYFDQLERWDNLDKSIVYVENKIQ